YECGRPRHFRKNCPKLRSQNRGNQTRNKTRGNEVTAKAYTFGVGGTNPDSNVVTGMFLLNNGYASMLFDSGTDRSFLSTTFSVLIDVAPSTLDTSYAVKLADGRIYETNIVLRGCTLRLLGHPFNVDLMPIELGSFGVIIGMDWLVKYHALIVCDKKVVRIPYADEGYVGSFPYYNKCRLHHEGVETVRRFDTKTRDCRVTVTPNTQAAAVGNQQGIVCYECGRPRHFRKNCPKLRSQNRGNQTRNKTG
nr:reverse transcriptase domain-containing protein [Tanacetum cinerariifolium]